MARISPSKLDYLRHCSRFCWKEFVENPSAAEGTMLHAALEKSDFSDLEGEQLNAVESAQAALDALKAGWLNWKNVPEDYIDHPELRLECRFGLRGTSDRVLIAYPERRAIVADWKGGRLGLITEAPDCLQLRAYADAVFDKFPSINEAMVALIAPRTQEVSTHVYTRESIERDMKEIEEVIAKADDPFAPPTPVDTLCSKCQHAPRCPAFLQAVAPAATQAAEFPVADFLKPVENLTPEEIARNLALVDVLAKFAENRKPALTARVFEEGLDIPGFSKRERAGNAFVASEDARAAYEKLHASMSAEDYIECCGKPSLTKLAEKMAIDGGDGKAQAKKDARQAIEDALGDLVRHGSPIRYLQRSAKLSSELLLRGE